VNPYDVEAIAAGLERILLDHAFSHDLRQRAPARAAQFSWDAVACRIVDAVHTTLAQKPDKTTTDPNRTAS